MRRSVILGLAVLPTVLAVGGCGEGSGLSPVYGKVLYRGEPAAGATVIFHRKGGDAPAADIPRGEVKADGSFRMASGDRGLGVAPGTYAVLVEWRQGPLRTHRLDGSKGRKKAAARDAKPTLMADDKLDGRYFDPARPRLTAEVKAETNNLPTFVLAD